jgi:isopentenyl diphosphate isomerase/L-lactate dehydrogenase-like FMN-dependent dehydrogenase
MKSAKIKEAQQSGKLTILFDSGIRTGSDIIKALALGAQAVLREFCESFEAKSRTKIAAQSVGRGCME